ncbi:MAG: ureidoglycolate lyase [Sandaracinaceae bacterium]|nr:ureidoglycolate lyase [Sandaracinaceae bacterium]
MTTIDASPIDRARYAPYGSLVAAGLPDEARSANHGTAQAWDALAVLESLRGPHARCTASLFRCHPWQGGEVLAIRRLERHPRSTQMFVPLKASRFLLVVALGADAPDLSTLAAFLVESPCAITYAPGVWHHPMIALDDTADFVNVLFADGTHEDCHEVPIAAGLAEVRVS